MLMIWDMACNHEAKILPEDKAPFIRPCRLLGIMDDKIGNEAGTAGEQSANLAWRKRALKADSEVLQFGKDQKRRGLEYK